MVVLIIIAGALGYYQVAIYPANHSSTSSVSIYVPPDPHNVTVVIVPGASSPCGTAVNKPPSDCNGKTYAPDNVTVVIGYNATVIWFNNETGVVHTVTAFPSDASFDPRFGIFGPQNPPTLWNNIPGGKSVNFTFIKPGDYTYYCSYHNWMQGSVIVKAGSNNSTTTSTITTTTTASSSATGSYLFWIWLFSLQNQAAVFVFLVVGALSGLAFYNGKSDKIHSLYH